MKTMQDFKNEESRKKYAILKKELNKYGPIGKLVKHGKDQYQIIWAVLNVSPYQLLINSNSSNNVFFLCR